MTKDGHAYCRESKSAADKFGGFDPSDSQMQERMMRCGVEAKVFQIHYWERSEIQAVATATLRDDFVKASLSHEKWKAENLK